MFQAILAYIFIFLTIFLCSVSISFTALKSNIEGPQNSKFRILQQKRIINGLLRKYNRFSSSQDSIRRELIFNKIEHQNQIITIDSLLNEMEMNQIRLDKGEQLINKNNNILSKALK